MEDALKGGKSGVIQLPHGKLYINRGKAPEIFYDSFQEPILIKPGESRFEEHLKDKNLGRFFISPELWNARQAAEDVLGKKTAISVLIEASKIDKYGDLIMLTVIPHAYKDSFGGKVQVDVVVPVGFEDVWLGNSDVRKVYTSKPEGVYDVNVDVNGVELKFRPKDFEDVNDIVNRTDLVLEHLGLFLVNKTPLYFVTDKEKQWAKRYLKQVPGFKKVKLVGIQLASAVKSRTYPHMREVKDLLARQHYLTLILDEKREGRYLFTFRQMAALVNECDLIVTSDSAILHLAGALRKRIVGVFGSTDGKIFTQDYEKAISIQATKCKFMFKPPCWWVVPCLPGNSYQEKENVGFVECLDKVHPTEVTLAVNKQLNPENPDSPKKVLVVMLTFNLLEMTKKAVDSIRSFHDYDLLVVDNESNDGTVEWLKERGIVHVVGRTSVAGAQNIGLQKFLEGDYDYLILLNNDLVLRRNTIDKLVAYMEGSDAFATMATTIPHVPPWGIDLASAINNHHDVVTDIPAGSYSCTIFSRKCIEEVGFFDERFTPRYIEDNDYTLRIRLAGGKFHSYNGAIYYHALGGVVKTNRKESKDYGKNWSRNVKVFREKWGIHPHEPQDLKKLGPEHSRKVSLDAIKMKMDRGAQADVVVERRMGGWGDILFTTVIARELKHRFGEQCHIRYRVPPEFHQVYDNLPFVDDVLHLNQVHRTDFLFDITDLEFRVELQEIQKYGEVKTSRTKVYLDILGFDDKVSIKPSFQLTTNEKDWGEAEWGDAKRGRSRVAFVVRGSNKLKEWPGMKELLDRIITEDWIVNILDGFEGKHRYTFRQCAAVVKAADVVVAPDSGISNLAATLDVPVVTIFSSRNGKVFSKMFSTMVPIQGDCPYFDCNYCDFKVPCLGVGPHRAKENINIPECLKRLTVEKVYEEVRRLLLVDVNSDVHGSRKEEVR